MHEMITQHFLTVAKKDSEKLKNLALKGLIKQTLKIPGELEGVFDKTIIVSKEEIKRQKQITINTKHLRTKEEYAQLIKEHKFETEDEWYIEHCGMALRIMENEAFENDTFAFTTNHNHIVCIEEFLKDTFLCELSKKFEWLCYQATFYHYTDFTKYKKGVYGEGHTQFTEEKHNEDFYYNNVQNILKSVNKKNITIKDVDVDKFKKEKIELRHRGSSLPF